MPNYPKHEIETSLIGREELGKTGLLNYIALTLVEYVHLVAVLIISGKVLEKYDLSPSYKGYKSIIKLRYRYAELMTSHHK